MTHVADRLRDLLAHLDDGCSRCVNVSTTRTPPMRARAPFCVAGYREEETPAKLAGVYGSPDASERAALRSSLGPALRSLRSEFGLSQWRLSTQAGTSRTTIEYLESGQRRPTPSLLASLVLSAAWTIPPREPLGHAAEVDRFRRLVDATGASLVVDTEGGIRRRSRRLRDAHRSYQRHLRQFHQARTARAQTDQATFRAGVKLLARSRTLGEMERALAVLNRSGDGRTQR